MKQLKHSESKSRSIFEELEKMEVDQQIDKTELIIEHWNYYDYWTRRSFDVLYSNARKLLPDYKFRSRNKIITRIS